MNAIELKELERRIDEVLFYVWDPIGVSDIPEAREEYTSYTSTLLKYVLAEEESQLIQVLGEIESSSIGMSINKEKNAEVAEFLIGFKVAIEEGLR